MDVQGIACLRPDVGGGCGLGAAGLSTADISATRLYSARLFISRLSIACHAIHCEFSTSYCDLRTIVRVHFERTYMDSS